MTRLVSPKAILSILLFMAIMINSPGVSAQDEYHVYFGNIDESPYPVPAHDTVNIPVYVSGARIGSGIITLYTLNLYISDRLGGNFYLNGSYSFSAPQYYEEYSRQTLSFTPASWGDEIFRLADFTLVMNADSTFYGDEVLALEAPTVMFIDTSGGVFYFPLVHYSPLLIQETSAVGSGLQTPNTFALFNAYPNPFNSSTTIRFSLPEQTDVAIEFYDISGRQVRSLNIHSCLAGENHATWDGRDYRGDPVSSGTYIYRLIAGNSSNFSRVTLIK